MLLVVKEDLFYSDGFSSISCNQITAYADSHLLIDFVFYWLYYALVDEEAVVGKVREMLDTTFLDFLLLVFVSNAMEYFSLDL